MRKTNILFLKEKAHNSSNYDLKCESRYLKETLMYNSNSERTAKL